MCDSTVYWVPYYSLILEDINICIRRSPHIPHEQGSGQRVVSVGCCSIAGLINLPVWNELRSNLQHLFFGAVLPFTSFRFELGHILAQVYRDTSSVELIVSKVITTSDFFRRTHCTPKSPVEKISIRFNPKQANISTDHRPSPRTATNFSNTSASEAFASIIAVSSPLTNFSARP